MYSIVPKRRQGLNYHTLRNNAEERRSHLHRGANLKSRKTLILCIFYTFRPICVKLGRYRGADKSLARPGRKTSYGDQTLTFASHSKKKFGKLTVQPGLGGSNDLRVGRKMATFQLFFSVGSG